MLAVRGNAPVCTGLRGVSACPSSLPFCCPPSTTCVPLTNLQSSVICCPNGSDCNYIEPITCDISLQNATAYPYNTVHTIQLNATLPTCAAKCCPLGYECLGSVCAMLKVTPTATTSSTTTPTPSSTGILIPTDTAISIIIANATSVLTGSTQSTSLYPPRAIAIGIIVGLAVGALLTFLLLFLVRHHLNNRSHLQIFKSKHQTPPETPLFGGRTPQTLASPLYPRLITSNTTPTNRTDFLLQPNSALSSPAPLIRFQSAQNSPAPLLGMSGTRMQQMPRSPSTPMSQMTPRRPSGLPPLFQSPLRPGLPATPSPPPRNPQRAGESELARSEANNPRPQPAATNFGNGLPQSASRGGKGITKRTASFNRKNSDDSYISTGSVNSNKTSDSSGTINVLMPPPMMIERRWEAERLAYEQKNVAGPSHKRSDSALATVRMMMDPSGLGIGSGPSARRG